MSARIKTNSFSQKDPISKYLPSKGWLADYLQFTSGLEACPRFQFFSACCVLGAAINNKCWIYRGDPGLLPRLFPNPWVILIAPPGRGHKTSTINMAVNCLIQARPDTRILADKMPPEALARALATPKTDEERIQIGPRDATGLIRAPELSVFFGRQQYNIGLVEFITDIYDYREEWKSETIGRGTIILKRNAISILGGSTPDWMIKMLPEDAFTGGFLSRFILVEMPPNYLKRIALPQRPEGISWKQLVEHLREISQIKGELKLSKRGLLKYTEVYDSQLPTGDPQKDAYYERYPEQMIRIAALLAISEQASSISSRHITQSVNLLTALQKETDQRIDNLTSTPRMSILQDITSVLQSKGGSTTRKTLLNLLVKKLTHGEQQFQEAVRLLSMAGKITLTGDPRNPKITLLEGRK